MSIVELIAKSGPISFSKFQELALYHPEYGFYENGGSAGGDFVTSPELGSVFAEVIGNSVDERWHLLGEPDPFYFVEVGAGRGTFASHFVALELECTPALRYIAVERSSDLRARIAPDVESRESLPTDLTGEAGFIFANELLDNLPVDIWDDKDELKVKAKAKRLDWNRKIVGEVFPEQTAMAAWMNEALRVFDRGWLVAVDYMRTTAEMRSTPVEQWLRSYRRQARTQSLFEEPGSSDITCDVALDQLRWVLTPDAESNQRNFLEKHGIDRLRKEAADAWQAGASTGDLVAIKAKSRASEIAALTDENGLGGFTVLEWAL